LGLGASPISNLGRILVLELLVEQFLSVLLGPGRGPALNVLLLGLHIANLEFVAFLTFFVGALTPGRLANV